MHFAQRVGLAEFTCKGGGEAAGVQFTATSEFSMKDEVKPSIIYVASLSSTMTSGPNHHDLICLIDQPAVILECTLTCKNKNGVPDLAVNVCVAHAHERVGFSGKQTSHSWQASR